MNTLKHKHIVTTALILAIQLFLVACQESDPELGPAPTQEEAAFTLQPTAANDNIIEFTNSSSAFMKKWDFGNGTKTEGSSVKGSFPLKGTYEVTLTIYTSGGSISSKQTVEIAETDPTLLDIPVYNQLTGGSSKPEGKTWVIDAGTAAHFGLGPSDAASTTPEWYKAAANEKAGAGMYDDKYTFKLDAFGFVQETNGDVFIDDKQAPNFPGAFSNAGDYTAPFTAPDDLSWTVTEEGDKQFLTISPGGFIGFYTGVNKYQIISISDDLIFLRYLDAGDGAFAWYLRLVPDGFIAPPTPTTTLPVDFEGTKPPFNGFGGSVYDVVANPDATGINTSAKVAKYIKGTEGSWAGIETTLSAKLDFSTKTKFTYKVYSPVTGDALFKIEATDGSATAIEVHADITQANQWQELTFDFSGAASNAYDKIALFLDFDNNAGGTFYLDDIQQVP